MEDLVMLFNISKEEIKQKINDVKWIEDVYTHMLTLCEPLMEAKRPYRIGVEGFSACLGRTYGAEITMLTTAGMVEGDAYTLKAKDMFLYIVEKHDVDYYHSLHGHLSVADIAFSLSICYDLLMDELNDEEKTLVLDRIRELGTYLYECNTTWRMPHKGVTACNHNAVHHGALGLCAILLENEEWLSFAVERIRGYFEYTLDNTGFDVEGVSYSYYGFNSSLVFCEAYYNQTGEDLVLEYKNIKELPNQFIHQMLPRYDALLSLGDHQKKIGNAGPAMYLISRFGYSDGLYLWRAYEESNQTYGAYNGLPTTECIVFPFLIHWANPKLPAIKPSDLRRPLTKKFDSGRVIMRTAWDDEMATLVSFTCGRDVHRGHNQPDQNSFTAYALGEDFLIDPGRFARDCRSHNLVMVNNTGQYEGCSIGDIIKFKEHGRYVKIIGDATEAYEWKELVGYAVRHLTFIKYPHPLLIIRDDIQSEKNTENLYEFMMITNPKNQFYQKDRSVYIKGCNYGNLCRIEMIHPEKIDIKICTEDRIVFRKFKASQFQKEAIISTKAVNPYFTSVISFAECEEDMPKISCDKNGDELDIRIDFKDGYRETVKVERFETTVTTKFDREQLQKAW